MGEKDTTAFTTAADASTTTTTTTAADATTRTTTGLQPRMPHRRLVIRITTIVDAVRFRLLLLLLLFLQQLLFLFHRFQLPVPPLLDAVGHLPPSKPERLVDAHLDKLLPHLEIALDEVQVLQQLRVVPSGPPDVLEDDRSGFVVFLPYPFAFGFRQGTGGGFPERRMMRPGGFGGC